MTCAVHDRILYMIIYVICTFFLGRASRADYRKPMFCPSRPSVAGDVGVAAEVQAVVVAVVVPVMRQ